MPLPTALLALVTYGTGLLADAITHLWQLGWGLRLHLRSGIAPGSLSHGSSLGSLLQQLLSHRETGEPSYSSPSVPLTGPLLV